MRQLTWQGGGALLLLLSAAGLAVARPPSASNLALVAVGGECSPGPLPGTVASAEAVKPLELAGSLARGAKDSAVVDVRPAAAYEDYHIPGAANVPLDRLSDASTLSDLPAGCTVVVCAADPVSAEEARAQLVQAGRRARVLADGIQGWWRDVMTPAGVTAGPGEPDPETWRARRQLRDQLANPKNAGGSLTP